MGLGGGGEESGRAVGKRGVLAGFLGSSVSPCPGVSLLFPSPMSAIDRLWASLRAGITF